uniref:Uncharacterized protein n=1 Tax=Ananas comosus var. bracteatus TaxID=296719 RepID=A0A6V7PBQ4_ANACO|nr:unnamed protein product [Ananas comosus var. bracteatus]
MARALTPALAPLARPCRRPHCPTAPATTRRSRNASRYRPPVPTPHRTPAPVLESPPAPARALTPAPAPYGPPTRVGPGTLRFDAPVVLNALAQSVRKSDGRIFGNREKSAKRSSWQNRLIAKRSNILCAILREFECRGTYTDNPHVGRGLGFSQGNPNPNLPSCPNHPTFSLPNSCSRPGRRQAAPAAGKVTPATSQLSPSRPATLFRLLCSGKLQSRAPPSPGRGSPPASSPAGPGHPRAPPEPPRLPAASSGQPRPSRLGFCVLASLRPRRPPVGPGDLRQPGARVPRRPRAPPAAAGNPRSRPDLCGPTLEPHRSWVLPPATVGCTASPSTSGAEPSPPRPPPTAAAPPGRSNPRGSGKGGSRPPRHRLPPAAGQHPPRTSWTECSLLRPDRPPPGRR